VLAADAAIPERSGGTADSAEEVIGTTVLATPMPVRASEAASWRKPHRDRHTRMSSDWHDRSGRHGHGSPDH